jgi:MEDS: MEthanogen/methylotroph, DcmR Sensory domain
MAMKNRGRSNASRPEQTPHIVARARRERVKGFTRNQVKHAVRPSPGYHAVRFYENEKSLSQIVADFLHQGLADGEPAIVVATPSQRAAILRALVAASVNVVQLQRSSDLVLLDGNDTLSTFMTDGIPDPERFKSSMTEAITRACRGRNCTVRIYGQMVDILWKDGLQDAAIRLELLWNQLAATQSFSLLCGYAMGQFYKHANFDEICRHHTHVVSADGEASAVA